MNHMPYSKLSILQTSIWSYFSSFITLHSVHTALSKSALYFPKDVSSFIGPDKRLQLPELGKQFNSKPRWSCSAKIGLRDGALWRCLRSAFGKWIHLFLPAMNQLRLRRPIGQVLFHFRQSFIMTGAVRDATEGGVLWLRLRLRLLS